MNPLKSRDAYRLWAPTYAAETVVSFLDEELAATLSPPLADRRLLDAGCGVGRRLRQERTALAVGIDASPEMLAAGVTIAVAAADVRALPFAATEFDLVWCRLMLGHLYDPAPAYCEMARVCRPGGYLFVTDFHTDAVAAGHRRSFRDTSGAVQEVEHYVHNGAVHTEAAALAGFVLMAQRDGVIGPSVEPFYACAGRHEAYDKDRGLAVVAALLFRRTD